MRKLLLALSFFCGAVMVLMAQESMPPAVYYESDEISEDLDFLCLKGQISVLLG